MSLMDTNTVIRTYLADPVACPGLATLSGRIYWPRAPERAALPNITFFTRGGSSTPYIADIPMPSKQFDCWATTPIAARQIYRALYDCLQGKQNIIVTIGVVNYTILSAREESQGQDFVDSEIPGIFRVLSFFEIQIK